MSSYSFSDFAEAIIEALGLEVTDETPSSQAELVLAEIERLQGVELLAENLFTHTSKEYQRAAMRSLKGALQ